MILESQQASMLTLSHKHIHFFISEPLNDSPRVSIEFQISWWSPSVA